MTGFDNSKELIKIANELLIDSKVANLEFILAGTKDKKALPFEKEEFDLIYSRRGPTSIINNSYLLKPGGIMFGIHSAAKDVVEKRLRESGLSDIETEVFDEAMLIFPNEKELEKYISSSHRSLDYSLEVNREAFKKIVKEHTVDSEIRMQEWRYVWKAHKDILNAN
ncbi:MAG: class I SAM-dependent methyltransferase [Clostridiales bacterium]|nr:class I SAM-dependent methyltransferase [Clostridiales bacterium]